MPLPPAAYNDVTAYYFFKDTWLLWVALFSSLAGVLTWVIKYIPGIPIQETEYWDEDEEIR